jgi:hypothetical protein
MHSSTLRRPERVVNLALVQCSKHVRGFEPLRVDDTECENRANAERALAARVAERFADPARAYLILVKCARAMPPSLHFCY